MKDATVNWQVIGQSVRGASHERSGLPNQDAIRWLPESGSAPSVVVAIADGHGSSRYPRSHIGAQLAVHAATTLLYEFLSEHSGAGNLSLIKDAVQEWLPKTLVRNWAQQVRHHLEQHPLSDVELAAIRPGLVSLGDNPTIAYGTTVVAVAATDSFILYLQLGDGEILAVSEAGKVSRPLIRDERLFGNETTSLCTAEAWQDFRTGFQPLTANRPALVLLSTDGYPNSFRDEAGFLQVGSDILNVIRADGIERVDEELEGWLMDSTRAGSGDDVTLAIVYSTSMTRL